MLDSPNPVPELPAEPQQRQRKVIHIDMDAFYASVEQWDDPALRGKPAAMDGLACSAESQPRSRP